MLSLNTRIRILGTKVRCMVPTHEHLPYGVNLTNNMLLVKELTWLRLGYSTFDNLIGNCCRKLFYSQPDRNYMCKYKNLSATLNVQVAPYTSSQCGDVINFVNHPRSSNIKFEIVESYQKGDKVFTKLTAQFRFRQAYGHETFFATYWKPGKGHLIAKGSINALVFICHGYAEYLGEAYDEVAKLWSCQLGGGCLVFGHDHVGHGRTTVGDRALVNDMYELVDPIIAHVESIQKWKNCGDGSLPVFLVGHSMGGLISLFTLLKKQSLFRGFIGICPLVVVGPDRATPTNKFLAKHIQTYFPGFTLPSFMDRNDDNLITRNKEYVEKLKKDTLRWHGGPKARMGWLLLQSCEVAQNNMPDITVPLLVLQGENDKLVDPMGAKILYENASSKDKEYKGYPEAFHQLFVELEDVKSDVHKKTLEWMEHRLNTV